MKKTRAGWRIREQSLAARVDLSFELLVVIIDGRSNVCFVSFQKLMRTILPVLLTFTCFLVTKEDGDGWRSVARNNKIKFNWTTSTLEVKTVELSNLTKDRKLEIIFNLGTQPRQYNILSMTEFKITGTLGSKIKYNDQFRDISPPIPPTPAWWTFQQNQFLGIQVLFNLLQATFFPVTNEDMVESFMFTSEDTASLNYRVTSTDKNNVDPGEHNDNCF